MIIKLLAVAFGRSIGAVSRFLIYEPIGSKHHGNFLWTTFTTNLLGSFVIGFLWGYFARIYVSQGMHFLIFVGISGGFTIFFTFAFDNFSLQKSGKFYLYDSLFPGDKIFSEFC